MQTTTSGTDAGIAGTTRPCEKCRKQTRLRLLDPVKGEDQSLAVTVHGLPVLECEDGHRQFVTLDFALDALGHLTEEDEPKLPAATAKGLVFKQLLCVDCGAELQPKPDHRHTFSVDVALPDAPPFQVDLAMPVYHCAACGKDQLHSLKEIRARTPNALARAFKAGGMMHA